MLITREVNNFLPYILSITSLFTVDKLHKTKC